MFETRNRVNTYRTLAKGTSDLFKIERWLKICNDAFYLQLANRFPELSRVTDKIQARYSIKNVLAIIAFLALGLSLYIWLNPSRANKGSGLSGYFIDIE